MPVRIYDLAKKLGIASQSVLAKAKDLGIAQAKVPSSSLDKITAEFLEIELIKTLPPPPAAAPPPPPPEPLPPVPAATPTPSPGDLVAAPTPPVELLSPTLAPPSPVEVVATPPVIVALPALETAPAIPEAPPPAILESQPAALASPTAPPVEIPLAPTPPAPPAPPVAPPPPPVPKIGEKVGWVQLPPKPVSRQQAEKGAGRGAPGARSAPAARGDARRGPGVPASAAHPQAGQRAGQRPPQKQAAPAATPAKAAERFVPPAGGQMITLKPPIIVRDLAEQLKRKPFQIIADLMEVGVFANVNQSIDEEVAQRICAKYGFRFEVEKRERGAGAHTPVRKVELDVEDRPEDMKPRAPVVTIMGHVDHGKTTLLDVIRKSNVAAGEAGGITQHIGAYTISFPHPERKNEIQQITFLDTPGHAAFSAMRARGATVTDIVVLVVAANDGVMPQTLEALSHAQAAKAPILVAVNKCDHPNANPMKVRQQLQDKGQVSDEWGGDTIFVDVSALTKQGVDKLLEMILLQADLLELKANPNRRAKGNVIESGLEPGGPTATVLVRKGTLRVGDVVVCGAYWGKVRALISEEGTRQKEAGPSVAVKILGLNGIPEAGLEFSVLEDEKTARDLADQRAETARTESNEARTKVTLETLFATLDASQAKILKVVVKGDTQGSVEAIVEALKKIEAEQVSLEVIHSAVGTITESDVLLASASSAIILGFHTRIDVGVADLAKREGVQIKLYSIIYELIDQVKEAMAGLLEPVVKEVVIGSAEVRKIFELSKGGNVAGCVVNNGRLVRGKARVLRRKGLIYEGVIQTLRRFQDDVNEVRAGMECGIRIEGFNEMQPGDVIECYNTEKNVPKLN
jgi:translation initiation factor IF-2